MAGFVKVGRASDVRKGRPRQYDVDGTKVAVFRSGRGFVAVSDTCPHMGASLTNGRMVDGTIECAWHHWRFDPETGVSEQRDWCALDVYEVRVEGNDLLLRPPAEPRDPVAGPTEQEPQRDDEDWLTWNVDRYFREAGRNDEDTDGDDGP